MTLTSSSSMYGSNQPQRSAGGCVYLMLSCKKKLIRVQRKCETERTWCAWIRGHGCRASRNAWWDQWAACESVWEWTICTEDSKALRRCPQLQLREPAIIYSMSVWFDIFKSKGYFLLSYPTTHSCLAWSLSAPLFPRLQVLNFIVDFVNHFMVGLQLRQICCKN